MLKARALFYAVIVSLLVSVVSAALVSLAYLQRLQQTDQFEQNRLINNVNSGLALIRSQAINTPSTKIDLYGFQEDFIELGKKAWGLYDIGFVRAISQATILPDTMAKICFLGTGFNTSLSSALLLTDHSTELALAGNTILKGQALVPNGRIRIGASNIPYTGTEIPRGEQKDSPRHLPKVDEARMEILYRQFNRKQFNPVPRQLEQSFMDTLLIFGGRFVDLDKHNLEGHIMIIAEDSIKISATSQLENILLFAPRIIIADHFEGQIQAFASKELQVGKSCHLSYPSVLALIRNMQYTKKPILSIGEHTITQGLVFAHQAKYFRESILIKVTENVQIEGQLFANGEVDFRGILHGNLSCTNLWRESPMLKVKNLLLNAEIDRTKLSPYFLSPFFLKEQKPLDILMWIK